MALCGVPRALNRCGNRWGLGDGHPIGSSSHDFCLVREETGAIEKVFYVMLEMKQIPGSFLIFSSGSADDAKLCM